MKTRIYRRVIPHYNNGSYHQTTFEKEEAHGPQIQIMASPVGIINLNTVCLQCQGTICIFGLAICKQADPNEQTDKLYPGGKAFRAYPEMAGLFYGQYRVAGIGERQQAFDRYVSSHGA